MRVDIGILDATRSKVQLACAKRVHRLGLVQLARCLVHAMTKVGMLVIPTLLGSLLTLSMFMVSSITCRERQLTNYGVFQLNQSLDLCCTHDSMWVKDTSHIF